MSVQTTKLYVREFDAWSFSSVHLSNESAESYKRSYMETIKEVIVYGNIENNRVYVVMDKYRDWRGVYCSEQEAIEICKMYPRFNYTIKVAKIIDYI